MMYLTEKSLKEWAGPRVYNEGIRLFESNQVLEVERRENMVYGTVSYGSRNMLTRFELLPDGSVESRCPCKACRERGIICAYVIATAMAYMKENADPKADRAQRIEERKEIQSNKPGDLKGFITRVKEGSKGAKKAELCLRFPTDWQKQFVKSSVTLTCFANYAGKKTRLDKVSKTVPLSFSKDHEHLLYVLEDFADGNPAPGELELQPEQLVELLEECPEGVLFVSGKSTPVKVQDEPVMPHLQVEMDKKTGELILSHEITVSGKSTKTSPFVIHSDRRGYVFEKNSFWPIEHLIPEEYQGVYEEPTRVVRKNVPHFLQKELPALEKSLEVETSMRITRLTLQPAKPSFRLVLSGTPVELQLTAFADYSSTEGPVLAKEDSSYVFAVPDPRDVLKYSTRNMDKERDGLDHLKNFGIHGTEGDRFPPISGTRKVMNFLNATKAELEKGGWKVNIEGPLKDLLSRSEWIHPKVNIDPSDEPGWFDVSFDYRDDNGEKISESEIEHALLEEKSYVERENRVLLIDVDTIDALSAIFDECSMSQRRSEDTFRIGDIHAGYISSCTHALEGVTVQAHKDWKQQAETQNRSISMGEIKLGTKLDKILRPYQKEGVSWLRYLEHRGFAGILADEMGLGKTVQTLAWINMDRLSKGLDGLPALIVCPTSLVENWADEAARFTPELKVYKASGPHRHKSWDMVEKSDMVITSYALLRRDMQYYKPHRFAIAVLDEAQHIKNHSTQNAKAAKSINAAHRLVLTGTPIENSVTDLWSIMDFLMPGYLGTHRQFKTNFEGPISKPGPFGEEVQQRLRRKIHPFIMRRLKRDVAKELPPKIERIATCTMSSDQTRVYRQVLESSRSQIYGMVAEQGFQKSRFEIFKTLLRLRQICCHLDLLNLPNLKAKHPSAKMELFMELMDEAMDGGNRVLVFSQFVSMLQILRLELTNREIPYCYLDGSTKNRQDIVNRFNADSGIPIFLISLKAGGTGLNLTGADTVIHFDPWWNPAVEDQATDRAHRIGQKRTVYSVKLITKDSVEEKVLALQKKKKAIIDATLSRDEEVMTHLSWDDVQELLTF